MSDGAVMNGDGGDAREVVLRRIRLAQRDVAETRGAASGEPRADGEGEAPRAYRRRDDEPRERQIAEFVERVREYRATVERVTPGALAEAIAAACATRGVRTLLVPPDVPSAWLGAAASVVVLRRDERLPATELDACDAVLTGCALGIAQTGTIVLDGGAAQGRRAITLVPDMHLCVVREDQIVGLVPEAITALTGAVRDERRPITFVSGPSATSDIELSRVEGVHGPRTLVVFVVAEG